MKLPRDWVRILCRHYGCPQVQQEDSHIILQVETPRHHHFAVPDHRRLRLGTWNAILRAVAAAPGVPKENILRRL